MDIISITILISTVIVAYFAGAIPMAYIVCKKLAGIDIRDVASGNVGARNTRRLVGNGPAAFVLAFDMLKGVIPVLVAWYIQINYQIYADISLLPAVAAIFAVIGHTKSLFLKFDGGKGVATGAGTIFALCWPVGLIVAIFTILLYKICSFRSMGIFTVVPASAILMTVFGQPLSYIIYCIIVSLYIMYFHIDNLKRYLEKRDFSS